MNDRQRAERALQQIMGGSQYSEGTIDAWAEVFADVRRASHASMVERLRAGWPCRLPGGDIYGPFEDALWMAADAIERDTSPDFDTCEGACSGCGTSCKRPRRDAPSVSNTNDSQRQSHSSEKK